MAPRIQPKRLFDISIEAVSLLIDEACTNLFLEYGCYGNEDSLHGIREIQNFLNPSLPVTVFEKLTEDRNSQARSHLWSKDARIKLAVFMHPCVRRFAVDGKGNELVQSHNDVEGLDEFFWRAHIRNMPNLTYLNLNLITTDDILLVVGNSCPNLEIVNIVSRIKQDNHNASFNYPNNSISLRFCVSDIGLKSILKCTKLRRVTMNKIINNQINSSAITYPGISLGGVQNLLFGLPNLEYINFGSIGKLIYFDADQLVNDRGEDRQLKLTYFCEMEPNCVDVAKLERFCPYIQNISLTASITLNASGMVATNVRRCNEILGALSISSLPLTALELQHFPFDEPFKQLLRNKGRFIEELVFRATGHLNSRHIEFIGQHCPNIFNLHLKEVGAEDTVRYYFARSVGSLKMFEKLKSLHITGRQWNPSIIIPLLLCNAHHIQHITLLNMFHQPVIDSIIIRLLQYNKLKDLKSLTLYGGCFLSLNMIRRLIHACPKLDLFSFLQSRDFDSVDVDTLIQENLAQNLDIKLQCLEMVNFTV